MAWRVEGRRTTPRKPPRASHRRKSYAPNTRDAFPPRLYGFEERRGVVAEQPSARQRRILLVDDEPDILESLQELIEVSLDGVDVVSVENGQAALEALEGAPFDLIISDYKMPGMNGLDFLAEARRRAPNVPRIIMTAFPDLDIAIRAINEAAIENFFTKPLDPDEIVEVVAASLRARQADTQRHQAFARALDLARRSSRS
jgi:adenylate cyclase